ncbi:MAG: nuclear transport factor 2 family protein [Chloroflexota bacterium]
MTDLDPVLRDYFEALNNIDRAAFVDCFAPDAVLQDPYGGPLLEGESGLNKFFDGMERTWSEFEMTPGTAYRSGNRVAVNWTTTATARSGKTANFDGVNVFELADDGSIAQLQGYWDIKAMLSQIRE